MDENSALDAEEDQPPCENLYFDDHCSVEEDQLLPLVSRAVRTVRHVDSTLQNCPVPAGAEDNPVSFDV